MPTDSAFLRKEFYAIIRADDGIKQVLMHYDKFNRSQFKTGGDISIRRLLP